MDTNNKRAALEALTDVELVQLAKEKVGLRNDPAIPLNGATRKVLVDKLLSVATSVSSDKKAKILDRARKLAALAKDKGATESEALAAASKLHELQVEYNISDTDIEQQKRLNAGEVITRGMSQTESQPWQRPIANAVASLYFCKYYWSHHKVAANRACGYIRYDIHNFVGEPVNVEIARLMFEYLIDTIQRLAKDGAAKLPPSARSPYITSFRGACANRVANRLWERYHAARRGDAKSIETGKNLPVLASMYDQAIAKIEASPLLPKDLRNSKRRTKITDANAAADGRRAGDRIGLDPQVKGGAPATRRIAG